MDNTRALKTKIPPNNPEAETAVLGALLLDPDALSAVRTVLTPEAFYSPQHQKIYKAICGLDAQGQRADILILTDFLRSSDELNAAGQVTLLRLRIPYPAPPTSTITSKLFWKPISNGIF